MFIPSYRIMRAILNYRREISSQLKILVDLANKVWQSNMQIVSFMVKLQTTTPSPDLRYTWAQDPVRFEDAMGRSFPIPSEYNWGVSSILASLVLCFNLCLCRNSRPSSKTSSELALAVKRFPPASTSSSIPSMPPRL